MTNAMNLQALTSGCDNPTEADQIRSVNNWIRQIIFLTIGSALLSQPVVAQGLVCQDSSGLLPGLIERVILFIIGVGIMIGVVLYFAGTLLEKLSIEVPRRRQVNAHKRTVYKRTALLVVAGPLLAVMGLLLGSPFPACVDLLPF